MTTRILPAAEYHRLDRTGIQLFERMPSQDVSVVVVENDGKIVACMMVLRATHFEGVWIDPQHRNAGVTRALLKLAMAVARCRGSEWVFAAAAVADAAMHRALGRLGAKRLAIEPYVLAVKVGGEECQQQP